MKLHIEIDKDINDYGKILQKRILKMFFERWIVREGQSDGAGREWDGWAGRENKTLKALEM